MADGGGGECARLLERSLAICNELGDVVGALENLHQLGLLAQSQADHARALELLLDAEDL